MFGSKKIKIVTHDGDFHADDIFAVATLELALGSKVEVIRTRLPEKISKGEYVVDVGGVYDAEKNYFDHHQKGGAGMRPNGIPYAAFGLVWKKFGEKLCGGAEVAEAVDRRLIMPIDAFDNGVDVVTLLKEEVVPYTISDLFFAYRPTWQEPTLEMDAQFLKAVEVAKYLLGREIAKARGRHDAENFLEKAFREASDKRLLILDDEFPWREFADAHNEILFVIKPKEKQWHLYAVRKQKGSFENRKDLPAAWAGKRDQELAKITGVPDSIFCHNGRFIAVAKSKEGILQLAKLALAN